MLTKQISGSTIVDATPARATLKQSNPSTLLQVNMFGRSDETKSQHSPTIRRPKREIHAPSKDLPDEDIPKRKKGSRRYTEEMRWCNLVFRELMKKQFESHMFPFYKPVDPIALNIPAYFDVITDPMDLSTVKKKLDQSEYETCEEFEADVRLIFDNCFQFNPPGSDVFLMAQRSEGISYVHRGLFHRCRRLQYQVVGKAGFQPIQ